MEVLLFIDLLLAYCDKSLLIQRISLWVSIYQLIQWYKPSGIIRLYIYLINSSFSLSLAYSGHSKYSEHDSYYATMADVPKRRFEDEVLLCSPHKENW